MQRSNNLCRMKEMPNCIFCKIVLGDIPSTKVYEDEHFLVFTDIHPQSPGHVQVIPKKHFRFVWDMPDVSAMSPNIGSYFSVVRKVARAMQGAFGTDYVFSKVMGDEVPHAHVWLFPHPTYAQGDPQDFEGNAEKIRSALR